MLGHSTPAEAPVSLFHSLSSRKWCTGLWCPGLTTGGLTKSRMSRNKVLKRKQTKINIPELLYKSDSHLLSNGFYVGPNTANQEDFLAICQSCHSMKWAACPCLKYPLCPWNARGFPDSWSAQLDSHKHLGRKFCHSSKDLGATLRHLAATQVTKHYRLWVEQKIHQNTVYIAVLW